MKKIKIGSLYWYGTTDMSGEWTSTGGWYMAYRRTQYETKFNYYISMRPIGKQWSWYLWIQMVPSNVCDLTLWRFSANTKKELKTMIEQAIIEFDESPDFDTIDNFIESKSHHIFVDDNNGWVIYIWNSTIWIRLEKEMYNGSTWIDLQLNDCFRGNVDKSYLWRSTYYEISKEGSWKLSFSYGGYSGTSIPADIKELCLSQLK